MDTVPDFEDLLWLLHKHEVRYLVVGGLAFIYHARPRYTKDMDLWVEASPRNVRRANRALAEFSLEGRELSRTLTPLPSLWLPGTSLNIQPMRTH